MTDNQELSKVDLSLSTDRFTRADLDRKSRQIMGSLAPAGQLVIAKVLDEISKNIRLNIKNLQPEVPEEGAEWGGVRITSYEQTDIMVTEKTPEIESLERELEELSIVMKAKKELLKAAKMRELARGNAVEQKYVFYRTTIPKE